MPTYEYACTQCGETTEVRASLAEKQKGLNVRCPACGSPRMARLFGGVSVGRSAGSGQPSCPPGAGPGCCCRR